jgi:hypothetical protein
MGDRGTHRGTQRTDGTVVAACGAVFEPRPLRIALPGAGDPQIQTRSVRSATAPRAPGDPLDVLGYLVAGLRRAPACE